MTRRLSGLLILFLLGVGIALAPVACGGDEGTRDASVDQMTPS